MTDADLTSDALDRALDDLLMTPEVVTEWLDKECSMHRIPLNAYTLARNSTDNLSLHECVAVLFGADDDAALRALHSLRERFATAHFAETLERAGELNQPELPL